MPLTPQQKQKLLTFQGLDTNWDIQENPDGSTQAIPKTNPQQPSASPDGMAGLLSQSVQRQEQETTATQAAMHHMEASAIPTTAGIGAGALGGILGGAGLGALTGAAEGSVVPGLGTLIGGLIGAGAGSYGASKLQEKYLSDKFKQQLALEQQQHPVASFVGEAAPSFAFFNPVTSLKNLPTLGSGIKNLVKVRPGEFGPAVLANTKTLSTTERAILSNAAINAGVGGGQELASQMSSDEPMNYGRLAATTGLGALLNEPWLLGKALGFHPMPQESQIIRPQEVPQTVIPQPEAPPVSFADLGQARIDALYKPNEKGKFISPASRDKMYRWKENEQPDIATLEGEGGITRPQFKYDTKGNIIPEPQDSKDSIIYELAAHKAQMADTQLALAKQMADFQNSINALKEQVASQPPKVVSEVPAFNSELKGGKNLPGEGAQFSEKPHVTEEELNALEKGQVPVTLDRLSPDFKNRLINLYAERAKLRGQTPNQFQPEVTDTQGKPVAGYHEGRSNVYSETKAGPDTLPHEQAGHGMINDLANSADPSDVKLVEKGKAIFKSDADPSESLAIEMGKKMTGRDVVSLYGTKGQKFKQYWSDVLAHFKVKTGLASDADVIQHLNRRFETDAPFGKNTELLTEKNINPTGIRQNSTDTVKEAPATYLGYQEGFGKVPGSHLYNLHEDLTPTMVKGSTVSRSAIEKAGYKIPPAEAAKEKIPENKQYSQKSNTNEEPEKIAKAAIRDNGKVTSGNWHYDAHEKVGVTSNKVESGFITNRGRFVSREEALKIARKAGQLYERAADKYDMGEIKQLDSSHLNQDTTEMGKQYSERSQTTPDDIKLGHMTDELKAVSREESPLPYKTFSPTRSVLDTIRTKGGKSGDIIANAIEKLRPANREIEAQYRNPVRDSISTLTPDESSRLEQILQAENKAGKSYKEYANTPRMSEAYDTVRETLRKMQQDQIDAKQPVKEWKSDGTPYFREAKINPTYFPNKMSPLVMRILAEHPESAPALKLKEDYMNLQKQSRITDTQAKTKWDSLLSGIDKSQPNMTRFNAVRKAEGTGLPDSFQQQGLLKNLESYIHRSALDRAHYEHVESKPEVASAMGYKTDPWGKAWEGKDLPKKSGLPEVKDLKERLAGEGFNPTERTLKANMRIATSLMLGPLTNIHIAFSSLANALSKHTPDNIVQGVTHMLGNWHESYQHAIDTGYLKKDSRHLSDLVDAHADISDKLGTAAAFIGKINGRDLTDKVTKTLLQGAGEFLTKSNSAKANLGDKSAIRFMKQVDNTWTPGKSYSDTEVAKLGSIFGEYLHGAHDERTLPTWMLKETAIQPFLSLMSWNIAQTNHFMKHVWTPATEGNMTPLIMTTLGSVAGGYVIKEMREEVSQRKAAFPNLQELAGSSKGLAGNIPLAAYNAMAMAQIAGFAGVLSTAAKAVFDIAYKNIPQGATFPLDELMINGGKTLSQGLAAAVSGDAPLTELAPRVLKDLLQENVQMARLAINWGAKSGLMPQEALKQEITKGSKDVRNWEMAEGMPTEEQTTPENNPYLNLKRQEFKRTPDIGQAAEMLPDLISRAFEKANGNPYVLQSQLRALKQNDFPTMPSMEKAPSSFYSYLMYLEKTQGSKVAQERLHRYMEQNMINKAKGGMVPSI